MLLDSWQEHDLLEFTPSGVTSNAGESPRQQHRKIIPNIQNKQRRNAFCIRRRIPANMLRAYFNKEFLCSKKFSENLTGAQTRAITTA
jgi:hypothetical protein